MAKNNKALLEETEKLGKENKQLHHQLREAKEFIESIKTGKIDAVVFTDKNAIKVYTEKSADKTYRVLIEKMHEGAVTLSENGSILYCNMHFGTMVNLPLQKIVGTKLKNFIDDSSKKGFEALLIKGREKPVKKEVYISVGDGKTIPVLMSVNTFMLDNHVVLSIILTDLTIQNKDKDELEVRSGQLEQINKELESANKDLTSFTYLSSHDLQEPLRKIQIFADLISIEEQKNLSDNGKDYFRRIQKTAKRMQALIEDLLAYSSVKTTERNFEKTDLTVIVDEVKKDLEEVIQEKKATIDAAHLCETRIIPFQFRQLIHNLIGNSLKFSNPDKRIKIIIKSKISKGNKLNNEKSSLKTDYCHIIYTDNGIGFDPQYKDRIFEVFQRLHNKESYPGTGMGLAICKRVVENHNGIITATGKLNKGSRFDIYIPA